MEASEAQRLRGLEAENAELKKLLAEAHLDMHALKSVLGKVCTTAAEMTADA
jgi:putative transposase